MMRHKISVIIPAFNEEKTIEEVLRKVIFQLKDFDHHIIVVNDGSKDRTVEKIQGFLDKVTLVNLEHNVGKGRAIREGLKKADDSIVIIQDADLELDPADYPELLKPILSKKTHVVYGSRTLTGKRQGSFIFSLGGRFITKLTNLLYKTNISDQTNGYKIMRRDILESINLESDGFEICSEITAKISKRGFTIHEVPVSYYPRSKKEGKKLKVHHGVKAAWVLIKHRFI